MYVEITKEAFQAIVTPENKCIHADTDEFSHKCGYIEKGCKLMTVNNFLSGTTQYYIQDINA